jgi:hypothetical protein
MSVITSSRDPLACVATRAQARLILAYCTGAAALAGEAAVHREEYVTLVHPVPWVGPLFLANAAACAVTIVGLAFRPTRPLAWLGGVVISALALGGLVVSYGQGLSAGTRCGSALATGGARPGATIGRRTPGRPALRAFPTAA